MRNKGHLAFSVILVVADFVALLAAFVLAYIVRVKLDPRPLLAPIAAIGFLKIFLLILPLWLVIFGLLGLYRDGNERNRLSEYFKLLVGCFGGVMTVTFVDFISQQPIFPARLVLIYGFGLSFILVALERELLNIVRRYLFRFDIGVIKTIVIGQGPVAEELLGYLSDTKRSGYKVVAVVASRVASRLKSRPRLFRTFAALLKHPRLKFDQIIQTELFKDQAANQAIMWYAHNHHLDYRFYPAPAELVAAHHTVRLLGGLPLISVQQTPLEGWARITKRAFDIAGATIGLMVLAPLLAILALIIKLTDHGPVFFRHRRLSRFGKEVATIKFRTMRPEVSGLDALTYFKSIGRNDLAAEFKQRQKVVSDPRVTPIGRFLRRTSLDELPQLWNVIRGDLSLVGPRPIVTEELKRYGQAQAAFLAVKPGLTGLWQVSGRSQLDYDERIELELYYVQNWSLLLDIKIILKTVVVVWRKIGAQ